jgi:hypothetical protein
MHKYTSELRADELDTRMAHAMSPKNLSFFAVLKMFFSHLRQESAWSSGARCLYNKVIYFRGFCVLVVGGAYV